MPELPEVETTARGIAPHLTGARATGATIRQPRLRQPVPAALGDHLAGQILRSVSRRAKYLLLTFDSGQVLVHLGMSGSLRIVPSGSPPQPHDHVDLHFGALTLRLNEDALNELVGTLGYALAQLRAREHQSRRTETSRHLC